MGNGMAEYVIRLSAQLDTAGIEKLMSYMDNTKLKALGLTAALSGISTVIYKFASSIAKKEFELQKLAKSAHKTTSEINAQNKALKAMGMTLDEVKKDKKIEKVYEDIKKFNSELEMKNVNGAMEKIFNLRSAFWKLKSTLNMLIQNIGRQFLINMERPITRITGGLNKISDWVKNNFTNLTTKLVTGLTAFSKGVFGIAEGIGYAFKKVNELPDGIKKIGIAFAGIFALDKIGPLGRILALITAMGDLIHDADNYNWNKEHGYKPGDEHYVRTLNDWYGIWDIFFGDGDPAEKAQTILGKFFDGAINAIDGFTKMLDEGNLEDWLEKDTSFIGKILKGVKKYLTSPEGAKKTGEILRKGIDAATSTLAFAGRLGSNIVYHLGSMIGDALGNNKFKEGFLKAFGNDNSAASGIITGLFSGIASGNVIVGIATGLITAYKQAKIKATEKLKKDNEQVEGYKVEEDPNLFKETLTQLGVDLGSFTIGLGEILVGTFQSLFSTANDIGGSILGTIVQGISSAIVGAAPNVTSEDKEKLKGALTTAISELADTKLFGALGVTLGTTIATGGNFFVGLITGILSYVSKLSESVGEGEGKYASLWDAIKADSSEFVQKIQDLWWGPIKEGTSERDENKGLRSVVNKILWGEEPDMLSTSLLDTLDEQGEIVQKQVHAKGGILSWLLGYDTKDESGDDVHVVGFGERIWMSIKEAIVGKGGVTDLLDQLAQTILPWISGLFDDIWIAMYNNMPPWVKTALEVLSGKSVLDPNKSSIKKDEEGNPVVDSEGNYTLESTNGKTIKITPDQYKLIMDYDLLGGIYTDGEGIYGNSKFGYGASGIFDSDGTFSEQMEQWKQWQDYLKEQERLDKENERIEEYNKALRNQIEENAHLGYGDTEEKHDYTPSPAPETKSEEEIARLEKIAFDLFEDLYSSDEYEEGSGIRRAEFDPDDRRVVEEAIQEYYSAGGNKNRFVLNQDGSITFNGKEPVVSVKPNVDTSSIQGQLDSEIYHINAEVNADGGDPGKAFGGRIGSKGRYIVGEDGTEYIIPITKPERAAQLINQMFNEMGSSAVQRIIGGLGLGQAGTFGANLSSLETAMGGMAMNNTYNINAPVNINVTSNGADAKEIGSSIYDMAERHLIKNVMGVYA